MINNLLPYADKLATKVLNQIDAEINLELVDDIISDNIYSAHIENPSSAKFQEYYFKTLNNKELFLSDERFFSEFKYQYSLQGIDNEYLKLLEDNKREIINLINHDRLTDLYFKFFKAARIKRGSGYMSKDLGSFFAKIVHTFRPYEYCPLDNPIRTYFGLQNESFYFAFIVISGSYRGWSMDNQKIIRELRSKAEAVDSHMVLKHAQLTDMKLLDLIFWSKAQSEKKSNPAISGGASL